jgi:hypothetical protein
VACLVKHVGCCCVCLAAHLPHNWSYKVAASLCVFNARQAIGKQSTVPVSVLFACCTGTTPLMVCNMQLSRVSSGSWLYCFTGGGGWCQVHVVTCWLYAGASVGSNTSTGLHVLEESGELAVQRPVMHACPAAVAVAHIHFVSSAGMFM